MAEGSPWYEETLAVLSAVAAETGIAGWALLAGARAGRTAPVCRARALAAVLLRRRTPLSIRRVGRVLSVDAGAVRHALGRQDLDEVLARLVLRLDAPAMVESSPTLST